MSACDHRWSMVDVCSGHLVIEGCQHCGARSTFFAAELVAPIDEYREGPHYWQHLLNSQAVTFNLRCEICDQTVDLSDVMGLMLSTCDDPKCEIGRMALELGPSTSIYVALCADSTHASGGCVGDDGVAALNAYFNQRLRSGRKKILVVPCRTCCDVNCCRGVIIADKGLIDL